MAEPREPGEARRGLRGEDFARQADQRRGKSKETEEVVEMLAESRISGFDGLLCCYTHSKGDCNDSRGCEDDTSDQARSNIDVFVTHFANDAAKETGYLIE